MKNSTETTSSTSRILPHLLWLPVLAGLYLTSLYSYLLFHTLIETFSVIVACGIFMVAWNARRYLDNAYFLLVGIAYLFVAGIDLLHTLAYKNMGVFPGADSNLPTQLWIAGRYLQGASLLAAPLFLRRRLKPGIAVAGFLGITALLLASIFVWRTFPSCFVEGVGLTPFKKGSEYFICLMLLGALVLMLKKREAFDREVAHLLAASLITFIAAELAFTLYVSVFGLSNLVGHLLKFAGFYLIYRAILETGIRRPYDLLFRDLKRSEERYRHLYNDTPVMLHSVDGRGRLISVSNYWLEALGYAREEVIGRPCTDFMIESSGRHAGQTVLPEFMRAGFCKDVPLQAVRKNGEVIDVILSAAAERDDEGRFVRSLAVMIDVTEQKQAAEEIEILNSDLAARAYQLEVANSDLEAFNFSVSHDLRTPLTVVNGYCDVLLAMCGDRLDEQCVQMVRHIHDGARRMNGLIETLLRFSRAGRDELRREVFDISKLAREISAEIALGDPQRRAVFEIEERITVNGDRALMRVVLENLLGNAWKYSGREEESRIEFGTVNVCGEKALFVRDNGAGFDMAEAGRLFDAFQRLHARNEFEGHGIGLATVQRIIQRHGGRVWAEGEVGKGATFYFAI